MKTNWLYFFYSSFNLDLLFWIVINALFLTTVKGMSEFNVILIAMVGLALSVVLFPLYNLIIKKLSNRTSNIVGAVMFFIAIVVFMCSKTIFGFIFAEFLYKSGTCFKQTSTTILRNNLKAEGREESFVKIRSFGRLGYSIVTAVIAIVSGIFFNMNPYLPVFLCIGCTIIGIIFSILFKDPKNIEKITENQEKNNLKYSTEKVSTWKIVKNKLMIYVLAMNVVAVGSYTFFSQKTNLLIQNVCLSGGFEIAKISIVVSVVVFISRLFRILANMVMPIIYKKTKKKPNVVLGLSGSILVAGICYALGGNLPTNTYVNVALIGIGLFIIISIRDLYGTIENKMIINNLSPKEHSQAFVIAQFYGNIGRLITNIFALIVTGFVSLNLAFIFILIIAVAQMIISIPYSKYLKE